jgi:(p)ppGpp synthase/HD superfamily hydrolase
METTAKTLLTTRFEEALIYATRLHSSQLRKGTNTPYVSHLLSVAALVLEDGGDEEQAIAALLHDAIEDCGGDKTRQEIQQKFGERIARIVEGCTDSDVIPKPPWRERKEKYIQHFRTASTEVHRVSLADKLHNARSILSDWYRVGEAIWSRFKGGKQGTIWYYQTLIAAAREANDCPFLTEELARVIQQLETVSGEKHSS